MQWVSRKIIDCRKRRGQVADRLPELQRNYSHAHATSRLKEVARLADEGMKPTASHLDAVADLAAIDERFNLDVAKELKLSLNQEMQGLIAVLETLRTLSVDQRITR